MARVAGTGRAARPHHSLACAADAVRRKLHAQPWLHVPVPASAEAWNAFLARPIEQANQTIAHGAIRNA